MIGQPRASPLPLIGGQARAHNAHCLLVELRILTPHFDQRFDQRFDHCLLVELLCDLVKSDRLFLPIPDLLCDVQDAFILIVPQTSPRPVDVRTRPREASNASAHLLIWT